MSDFLCEELILEIFTRLPPKSLLRFRSLSKSLYSCISSPSFVRMHTFRSARKLLIRHRNSYVEKDDTEYSYTLHLEDQLPLYPCRGYMGLTRVKFPHNRYVSVVGSSNGVICLVDHGDDISLWNPSIRRKLTLPDCPWRCSSGVSIGFGFDPISDDYKIVSIPKHGGIADCSFVYTLKTGAWSAISSPTPLFSNVILHAYFVSGALHWIVQRYRIESEDLVDFRYIITFDFRTHVFGMIALLEPTFEKRELTTIQGSLAMISTEGGYSRIWVWRDASWYVVFELKLDKLDGGFKRVLHLSNNGDLLFSTYSRGFEVYNLKIGARSRLVNFNVAACLDDIVMYEESLQLLDMGIASGES